MLEMLEMLFDKNEDERVKVVAPSLPLSKTRSTSVIALAPITE